ARAPPSRLRLLRPWHPREPRSALRAMPWRGRFDAAHAARGDARNAMVPRVPSRSRRASRRPAVAGAARQAPAHRLLHMPSIGRSPIPDLWRALDEREGARGAAPVTIHFSAERREFLKLAAASLALAGGACSPPVEQIVASVRSAEGTIPGVPRY